MDRRRKGHRRSDWTRRPVAPGRLAGHRSRWIIRRSRWNNGFATEAARAALDWTWANVDTDRVISVIQPDNLASIRVAEKIGERFERNDAMNGADVCIFGVQRNARQTV